jgi:hypothetical protein
VVNNAVLHLHGEDILGILEVYQIHPQVPVAGVFHIGEKPQPAGCFAGVGDPAMPAFVIFSERNKIADFDLIPAYPIRYRIRRTMAADGFIRMQGFPDGLPGSRPVIARILVTDIKVPPRLVEFDCIGAKAHKTAQGG